MTIPASLRALMSGLIDYAGLFPPAALDMQTAVANYARYLGGPDAWALGRFVLPVARFGEFESAMSAVRPVEPWGISALLSTSYETELSEIDRFNQRNQQRAVVDTVEARAATLDEICHVRALLRGSITSYFEIPPEKAAELLPTIKALHARAKIRTGGVTADAIPSAETVARFLIECARQEVAFKATAGLHHPVRCVKPLTYDFVATFGLMHGFLNVFLAATMGKKGASVAELTNLLEDDDATHFRFDDDAARWRNDALAADDIRETRQNSAISFGSCSFEEPFEDLADLREMKLL